MNLAERWPHEPNRTLVVAACLVSTPTHPELRLTFEGSFEFLYETDNGILAARST